MALSCPVLLCPYQDDLMPKSLMLVFLVTIFANNLLSFGTSQPHSTLLPSTLSPNSASALVGLIPWQISTNNNIFQRIHKLLTWQTSHLCAIARACTNNNVAWTDITSSWGDVCIIGWFFLLAGDGHGRSGGGWAGGTVEWVRYVQFEVVQIKPILDTCARGRGFRWCSFGALPKMSVRHEWPCHLFVEEWKE